MTKKYILHPGGITSERDGQLHYVSAAALAKLYSVDMSKCIVVTRHNALGKLRGMDTSKMIKLYPSYDGDYSLPERGL